MCLKGNILIVDDEEGVCNGVKSMVNEELPEVRVFIAEYFKQAIKILKSNLINVVITDMLLKSKEDGFELLRFIKTHKPLTQVIVLTGHSSVENAVKCMRIGCFDYLSKTDQSVYEKLIETTQKALELSNYPIDRESLTERLMLSYWNEMVNTKCSIKKGIALEYFCSLLFRSIPGWQQIESQVKTEVEEIDLVILNESQDATWAKYGTYILVECKNWGKRKPGRSEFDAFYLKIRRRGNQDCRLGFFISINGIAKTINKEIERITQENIKIVVLDKRDMWSLFCADNRSQFLKRKVMQQIFGSSKEFV